MNLSRNSHGDSEARPIPESLLPHVYGRLRALAQTMLTAQTDHLQQGTDLVHEALARLNPRAAFENDLHYFNAVALVMRRILVDQERARNAKKRGGGKPQLDLSQATDAAAECDLGEPTDLLAVLEAVDALFKVWPDAAMVVRLWLTGNSIERIDEILGTSGPGGAQTLQRMGREYLKARLTRTSHA